MSEEPQKAATNDFTANLVFGTLCVAGTLVGAAAGYLVFSFLLSRGIYALVLPGYLVGLGLSLGANRKSTTLGVVAAILAVIVMVFCEWHRLPFVKNSSLGFFVTHLHAGSNGTFRLISLALGAALAFWQGQRK